MGIGASAGGLEALELFLSHLEPACNMAFVVIQHLSRKHKSIMADLLKRHTGMKILQIEDGVQIEPNRVYLNPPDRNVIIVNRKLFLMKPTQAHGINLPIDCFFKSLSEEMGEKAICIILSGTAADGTQGLKAIKGAGGMAMVQEPGSAKYDGMPRNAIATGLVDFILPAEKLPLELLKYTRHPFIEGVGHIETQQQLFRNYLQKTLGLIRSSTGHDFSNYKQTTIRRRVERRMAVHQLDKIEKYFAYVQRTPGEIEALFKDLLIGVTGFFRDPDAFEALKSKVIPFLFQNRPADAPLRIWVAGCATGEEAYSLAMLFLEAMDQKSKTPAIQIFASDIDNESLDFARQGVYPESIAADVPTDRLNRFFINDDNTYKIKKQVRDMIVFADQDIIKDPPFSRLDLVSCRNLLIYMEPVLQRKILPMLHYTLTPAGILFLGPSESIGENIDLFEPLDKKWKIYRSKQAGFNDIRYYPGATLHSPPAPAIDIEAPPVPGPVDIYALAERLVLENYALPSVLINQQHEIMHFIGQTEKYLAPPTGRASFNILKMAREGLRFKLGKATQEAARQHREIISKGLNIRYNNRFLAVDIIVRPLATPASASGFFLVIFDDKTAPQSTVEEKHAAKAVADPYIQTLEQELRSTKEYLQTTNEELETSNEELKSTNEELQSVNEELQSTNEELETSKEELQSTNEELVTVNAELQSKVEELSTVNNDINNLLSSTEIGTIFLDLDLRIKRYTPPVIRIFNLIPTDVGRPISDITTNIRINDVKKRAREVLDNLVRQEIELQDTDGTWYSMRVMPYRTMENVIEGIVLTFVDISQMKELTNLKRLAAVMHDSYDAILVQDFEGNIRSWSRGARHMYGWDKVEALSMNISALIPADKRQEYDSIIRRLAKGESIKPFETQRRCKNGKIIEIRLTATTLMDNNGRPVEIATIERDISEWKRFGDAPLR